MGIQALSVCRMDGRCRGRVRIVITNLDDPVDDLRPRYCLDILLWNDITKVSKSSSVHIVRGDFFSSWGQCKHRSAAAELNRAHIRLESAADMCKSYTCLPVLGCRRSAASIDRPKRWQIAAALQMFLGGAYTETNAKEDVSEGHAGSSLV